MPLPVSEGWLPPPDRRPFESYNAQRALQAALQRWDGNGNARIAQQPTVTFSGRVHATVTPYAMGVDPCIFGGRGTYALCSSQIRSRARAGDIILVVSPPRSSSGTRGLQTRARCVLSIGLVESRMPSPVYHSLAAPPWAEGRPDRIYVARLLNIGATPVASRERAQQMGEHRFARLALRPNASRPAGQGSWDVDYGSALVRFILRSEARYHSLEGVNRVHAGTRWRDFTGFVLASTLCRTFSGQGQSRVWLPRCLSSVRFGRGGRTLLASRGSGLRRWLAEQLGHDL